IAARARVEAIRTDRREHGEGRGFDEGGIVRVEILDLLEDGGFADLAVKGFERGEIADDVVGGHLCLRRSRVSLPRVGSVATLGPPALAKLGGGSFRGASRVPPPRLANSLRSQARRPPHTGEGKRTCENNRAQLMPRPVT